VLFVERGDKRPVLAALLESEPSITRALVFTQMKHTANRVAEYLQKRGIEADAIHGNKSQNARERALARFKAGQSRVLVATDIAARGIDIDEVSHVVNYELPNVPETYVHRIGRTARAGKSGIAISLCDDEERAFLRDIERLIRLRVPVMDGVALVEQARTSRPAATQPDAHAPARSHAHGHPRPNAHAQGRPNAHARPAHAPRTTTHAQPQTTTHAQPRPAAHGESRATSQTQPRPAAHGQPRPATQAQEPHGRRGRRRRWRRP
jgi:ATP-dependent RNA helicase RhlE